MPFVHLQLEDGARGWALAPALARAIAAALDLGPDDVLVSVVGGASVSDGHGAVRGWPSAVIHGSPRPPASRRAAVDAARAVLADALSVAPEEMWVQWSTG